MLLYHVIPYHTLFYYTLLYYMALSQRRLYSIGAYNSETRTPLSRNNSHAATACNMSSFECQFQIFYVMLYDNEI